MRSVWANAAVLSSVLRLASASPVELQTRQTTSTCTSAIHIMIAGGCHIPCPADNPSLLTTLINNITTAFPGSDQYIVPYNNSEMQGQVSTPVYEQAVRDYVASCPQSSIVMLGYSLGGIIVMNTLCGGISTSYTKNVIAAITYGEETYRYPETWDTGTCTANAPGYPRNNTAQCQPYASVIRDYCDSDDPDCCIGGTSMSAHFAYANRYDYDALAFIKQQYAAFHKSTTSTTTTHAPTSTIKPTSTHAPTPTTTKPSTPKPTHCPPSLPTPPYTAQEFAAYLAALKACAGSGSAAGFEANLPKLPFFG